MLSIFKLRKKFLLCHVPTECLLFTSHLYGGTFEVQPGSRVQYFNLKLQEVQLRLRDAQVPSLPSAALQGFWFLLPPFSKSKEPYNPVRGSDSGLCAGTPVGTTMPYLFLTKHVRHSWRLDLAPGGTVMPAVIWILLFMQLGTFRPLGLGTSRPSVCLCHLG